MALPQLSAPLTVTDGGLETTLVYQHGIDLPDFAAFPLVDTEAGRVALAAYYEPYLDLGQRLGVGVVVDTPTWRANLDWGARLGYDAIRLAAVNRRAVEFVRELATNGPGGPVDHVIDGVVGPRGDGYVVGETMSASEAAAYHGLQARAFAEAGAEMITGVTMTYVDEAIGVTRAASAVGLPVVISFTVETDGALPSGEPLGDAIARTDDAAGGAPAYYMVNCAHPTHFAEQLDPGRRVAGTGEGDPRQRLALQPCRARRGDRARSWRRGRSRRVVPAVALDPARSAGGRRMLRHRPRARHGHRRGAGWGAIVNANDVLRVIDGTVDGDADTAARRSCSCTAGRAMNVRHPATGTPPGGPGNRQLSRMLRSSWRSRCGSATMSISTILPPWTVNPPTANGSPSRRATAPTAPLTSASCMTSPSRV